MAFQKYIPPCDAPSMNMKALSFSNKGNEKAEAVEKENILTEGNMDIDLREIYFLIMHFLSGGPCQRTYGQLWNELLEHQLLPRRYHAWYSRSGVHSGDENDDGKSFPLNYGMLVERFSFIERDHLVKLFKQLILSASLSTPSPMNAASVPTLLGAGSFSLLSSDGNKSKNEVKHPPVSMRWPHMLADQVRGLSLREIGGGFSRHHRAPSTRAACYSIAKPCTMVQKMQNIKRVRGHRHAVYCAIFDRSGRFVITGSDDRLVKIWSMETAYCLASCRGHEGDITDLAVNFNNTVVASSSNDCIIRVWRLPDGLPISVLRGHTGAVTAIAFSPRPTAIYQLLSSSDDGTCRIWDARYSQFSPRLYVPKPLEPTAGRSNVPSSSTNTTHQIFCCAFNASGTVFVTGSSDTLARVWNACKSGTEDTEQPIHEMDILAGHENDVNYVQFSGCAVASRISSADTSKEEKIPKFKNTLYNHDNIVTCSRDGSAIIWVPRSRRSHGKVGRWIRAYHLKVPPPAMPPQLPRGGPRQRILPTPRGVNMIVWSLDNRFVLAAIMDCRICVWNAADGSLVHSLTGHTESTYVLDVHPFNPRIAMSAGYDGKTIVWDIWEGIPIRTYEIGRFKLVDGKFSSDGTSIILSDDVGQLYILNTGEGELQKDAKYDQFFLGDYRPLIQDTHGNVLDQESQLAPYRRNMQDLLCDSGMIPYTEPYQSMYQKRRLGALGIEWHPSSVRFAVGAELNVNQEYQILPLADLDIMIEPLPEFIDAMDWEPEIDIQSDDNDSEYNITEECSSGPDQRIRFHSPSAEPDDTSEEEDEEEEDGLRRSTRKKNKEEMMTSSGRRVKRKNLDECDERSPVRSTHRKSRNGRTPSKKKKKKSCSNKSLRPQRAAARNALHLFSRITGTSKDVDDDDDEEDEFNSSQSESTLQDSNVSTEESDVSTHEIQRIENSKGKEIYECPEPPRPKKRLVLRLAKPPQNMSFDSQPGPSTSQYVNEVNHITERIQSVKPEEPLDLLEGCKDGKICWGGVKARSSSKRIKMAEPSLIPEEHVGTESLANEHVDYEKKCDTPCSGIQDEENEVKEGEEINTNPPQEVEPCASTINPMPTKLRIKYSSSPSKIEGKSSLEGSEAVAGTETGKSLSSDVCNNYERLELQQVEDTLNGTTNSRDGMFRAVYRRSKTNKERNNSGSMVVSTSSFATDQNEEDEEEEEEEEGEEEVPRTRSTRLLRSSKASIPCEEEDEERAVGLRSTRNRRGSYHHHLREITPPPDRRKSNQSARSLWLMLVAHEEGSRYIPQQGDEVVYFRQGHQEYITNSRSRDVGPWKTIKGNISAVEFCRVVDLEYSTLSGSGDSCCKMSLEFVDPTSEVTGKTFKLTLPDLADFPDFLVLKSRYDVAMERKWTQRDKCQVWWNDGKEDGSWWEGRIVDVKAKSGEFPDSPWDRYVVQYKSDPKEKHQHSPWELYDANLHWEAPHIHHQIRDKLLNALSKLMDSGNKAQDYYGIRNLKDASLKTGFVNRFPVPLSVEVIRCRLENNYYRSLEAIEHDIQVLISNGESYFGKSAVVSTKMRKLSEWFKRTLESL